MQNGFSVEEIKNSVEFQWRKSHIKLVLSIWLITAVITLFIPTLTNIRDIKLLGSNILIWLCSMLIFGLFFLSFHLFNYSKMRYLVKNYHNFNSYEVILDNVSTSYAYKGYIYYRVKIIDDGVSKLVDTNPYFSNSIFAKFTCDDYNNKKVIGLYDDRMNKFYILKKVN